MQFEFGESKDGDSTEPVSPGTTNGGCMIAITPKDAFPWCQ